MLGTYVNICWLIAGGGCYHEFLLCTIQNFANLILVTIGFFKAKLKSRLKIIKLQVVKTYRRVEEAQDGGSPDCSHAALQQEGKSTGTHTIESWLYL
jgi:hypothetical protein